MSKLATIPGFVRVGNRLLKKSDIILIEPNGYRILVYINGLQDPVELGARLGDFIKKMKREDQ